MQGILVPGTLRVFLNTLGCHLDMKFNKLQEIILFSHIMYKSFLPILAHAVQD